MRIRLALWAVFALLLVALLYTGVLSAHGETQHMTASDPGASSQHILSECDEGCRALNRLGTATSDECDELCRDLRRIQGH